MKGVKLSKISKTKESEWFKQASILSKALPFMQYYNMKNITIKLGGAAMGDKGLSTSFAKAVSYTHLTLPTNREV